MRMTARCSYDAETHLALVDVQTASFRLMRLVVVAALLAASAFFAIYNGVRGTLEGGALRTVILTAVLAAVFAAGSVINRERLKKTVSGENGVEPTDYRYVFEGCRISADIIRGGRTTSVSLRYEELTRLAETKRFFFLFRGGDFPFAIDKATVEGGSSADGGSADELREILTACVGAKNYKKYGI